MFRLVSRPIISSASRCAVSPLTTTTSTTSRLAFSSSTAAQNKMANPRVFFDMEAN
ncbi:hypothetical protein HDU76_000543, partial [Blyttiomyces sp. JEL0837]